MGEICPPDKQKMCFTLCAFRTSATSSPPCRALPGSTYNLIKKFIHLKLSTVHYIRLVTTVNLQDIKNIFCLNSKIEIHVVICISTLISE